MRIGEKPGNTLKEEASRGVVAAEVATEDVEDVEGREPAVADTVADPTEKKKEQSPLKVVNCPVVFREVYIK